MTAELTESDRGKKVVNGTERIGVVTDVRGGTAYVDPDWDHVPDGLAEALNWDEEGPHDIDESSITAIRNDEVRLRDDLI